MDDTKKLKMTSGACTGYGEWNTGHVTRGTKMTMVKERDRK